ncbi:MAG: heavy metal-associated domain-containing protein [Flavobacterium sp.]|nr:heavy metal-associated domain-containing protein [Flavobacterium sp.]
MNFLKSLLTLSLVSGLLFSCKEKASKLVEETKETTTEQKTATVAAKPETASFKIEGMTCAIGCAKTIETKLSKMNGVQKAAVDFDKKEAIVNFDAAVLSSKDIVDAVQTTGDGETYKVLEVKVN